MGIPTAHSGRTKRKSVSDTDFRFLSTAEKRKPPEGGFLVNHDLREESDGSG